MISSENAVMTIEEVSKYLKMPKSTIYKLAQEGKLPCRKVGRAWRFYKKGLEEWLQERPNLPYEPNNPSDAVLPGW